MAINQEINSVGALLETLAARSGRVVCRAAGGSERAYVISRVMARHDGPILALAPSAEAARRLFEDLQFFSRRPEASLLYFPHYHILPFKFLSYHNETAAERIRVLYRLLMNEGPAVVVAPVQALLQKLIPRAEISRFAEWVVEGEELDREALAAKLISGGYMRTAIVEEPGDFAFRGGIIDVFSPLYENPLRIEFVGDQVDSLRFFSAADQRRVGSVGEAVLLPAREAILRPEAVVEIVSRIRLLAAELGVAVTQVRKIVTPLLSQEGFPGIESLLPLVYAEPEAFFDYWPPGTLPVLLDPDLMEAAACEFAEQAAAHYESCRQSHTLSLPPEALYLPWEGVRGRLQACRPLEFKLLDVAGPGSEDGGERPPVFTPPIQNNGALTAELRRTQPRQNLLDPLAGWIRDNKAGGLQVLAACQTKSQAERLIALLKPYGIRFRVTQGFPADPAESDAETICLGRVSSGFVWPQERLALVTDDELFGVRHLRRRKTEPTPRAQLMDLQELKAGDLIVHTDHGIGQYDGLQKLTVEGVRNDYLVLVYHGGDKLYLPVDRMAMVQKYMGVEGHTPALDKLGGRSWERVKSRVKRSAEKMAAELLRIYAQRKVATGYPFGEPDTSFNEFESGFAFEETPDQLKVIEDVLEDMRRPVPMDRLVCGDVGYGKTEVALRAAFLAVNSGKQVAVLVPTTILAEQHFATFRGRFQRHPVNIACLSRFRSRKEQQAILEGLRAGTIDIVVGTHRLIQPDVVFKDLGLLVLDEEQRFGVRHKEKLKRLRANVDVLALTATPIPRTLHMSLVGVRDISLIRTPPEYRRAIVTYISEFDDDIIAEAVRRELKRRGQIYFVHNDIHNIHKIARHLQDLVPEARIDAAHGQMAEEELERVMARFVDREIDLLVCTTIIESGLDIPSANTIIVNRADCFGLAQMYQLRGRVGRSDEQAYAYLLIPNESLLTADARKRLKVLMEHSDLGAGFQIAMNDLEIRGGGTILGTSQSGHIAAVGYDMFLQLMEEAVAELKGEPLESVPDPEINLQLSALFSEAYIPDIDQRMALYRRLSRVSELQEIADIRTELTDRYGPPPPEAANLLFKIMLKVLARRAGLQRLDLKDQKLVLFFSPDSKKTAAAGIVDMVLADPGGCELTPDGVLKLKLASAGIVGQLAQAKNILQDICQRVNSQEN
jgi:transcription-repair coupling factor (superfamily II helicase)